MDRSSFRVAITDDKDKREAFKKELVRRIENRPKAEAPAVEEDSTIPVGRSVWHPNFGVGTIVYASKEDNRIVLSFANHGKVGFILDQIMSKLSPVDEAADLQYVPIRPVVATEAPPKIEKLIPELNVELPVEFDRMVEKDMFVYLQKEKLLTIDQANDVVSALKGQPPLYNKVVITMER